MTARENRQSPSGEGIQIVASVSLQEALSAIFGTPSPADEGETRAV